MRQLGPDEVPTLTEFVRDMNEVCYPGEGKISFGRTLLRVAGHTAIGTDFDSLPEGKDLPPVNPFKLTAVVARCAVDRKRRHEILSDVGANLDFGDVMGLVAVIMMYDEYRRAGLPQGMARDKAWNTYQRMAPSEDRHREAA